MLLGQNILGMFQYMHALTPPRPPSTLTLPSCEFISSRDSLLCAQDLQECCTLFCCFSSVIQSTSLQLTWIKMQILGVCSRSSHSLSRPDWPDKSAFYLQGAVKRPPAGHSFRVSDPGQVAAWSRRGHRAGQVWSLASSLSFSYLSPLWNGGKNSYVTEVKWELREIPSGAVFCKLWRIYTCKGR